MSSIDERKRNGEAPEASEERREALQGLEDADKSLGRMMVEINEDGECTLEDLDGQINALGEECPDEYRTVRREAENALDDLRASLADAEKSIGSLLKHLKSLQ